MRRTDRDLPTPPAKDRPNRPWLCGQLGQSNACDNGPDGHGRCPLRGVCKPKRTWQGKRRPWLVAGFAFATAIVAVAILFPINAEWVKPGDLSTPHSQILSEAIEADRCATCHAAASSSALSWFFSAGRGHAGVEQTDRCLNCHHSIASASLARSAHNVPEEARQLIRLASTASRLNRRDAKPSTPLSDQDNLACGVCHQEHHGASADLKLVSDAKCQTCHSTSFDHFATDHPDWDAWPYGMGGEIAFDHATHLHQHFPASTATGSVAEFRCASCHDQNTQHEITRTRSYEAACAACHDGALKISSGEGIELVTLPMLPANLAAQQADWPTRATGFLDGTVSPLAELLLRSDPSILSAIATLPSRNFAQANIDNPTHRDAASTLARGAQSLLVDVASSGQSAITRRAEQAGIRADSLNEFLRTMPPQLIADTLQKWFSRDVKSGSPDVVDHSELIESSSDALFHGGDSLAPDDSLLGDNRLTAGDPLLPYPSAPGLQVPDPLNPSSGELSPKDPRFDATTMMPAGGWYRDDVRMSIRYRGVSHSDATLRAVVEMAAQVPASDPVRVRILQLPAIKSCIECHLSAINPQPTWVSNPRVGRTDLFTKFAHSPHLNIAKLADCNHCHQVASLAIETNTHGEANPVAQRQTVHASLVSHPKVSVYDLGIRSSDRAQPDSFSLDFEPLSREACIGCHTPQAANDSCTTCHRYHIR